MKYRVDYCVGTTWYPLEEFTAKEYALDYIKYESERDEYMTITSGIDHTCEYRVVEVIA